MDRFTGTALRAASIARQAQTPVTSDIEHVGDRTEELIASVTYPIFNEHLPVAITGESDPERALRKLRRLNPGVLCVTLGERGAAALEGDRFHVSRAFSVDVVDNTGAGDRQKRAGALHRQVLLVANDGRRRTVAAGCTALSHGIRS